MLKGLLNNGADKFPSSPIIISKYVSPDIHYTLYDFQ